MGKISRNFTAGKMNKTLDERVVPQGEYIDALNIRMGSTEQSEIGVVENTKGNTALTALQFDGVPLSNQARTIGSIADGEQETIYWFVHDPNFPISAEAPLGKIDMIVSFSETTNILNYHIISVNYDNVNTTLNFNPQYLITGVDIIENLLFFTDDYNQPRFINTLKGYSLPIGGIDDSLLWESILVIKRPPVESPEVELTIINGQENYLEDRFICFAYRYEYEDNQYSAISQFSAPAFFPKSFDVTNDAFLNEGMINQFNAAIVTVNTGGPLVKSIDLLFKDMNSNVIKVIEKVNKQDFALSDDDDYPYTFSNSKIFTILPESELLRLYDNVPLKAKAQTIMGNRLMYGNYVEGYDLIDRNDNLTMLEYYLDGVSEEIGIASYDSEASATPGSYSINGPINISDSILEVDLTGAILKQGGLLNIDFTFNHAAFSGGTNPIDKTSNIVLSLFFELPQDYASVYDMVTSIDFQNRVGTVSNILPVYDPLNPAITPCSGTTFTDSFNCSIPQQLDTYEKRASGISINGQPISIIATSGSSIFTIQLLAMQFVDDLTTPTISFYEYYKFVNSEVTYQERGNRKSLHSNRDYEIGIVYMDEFNRSTTALVSPRNTIHFPCGTSDLQNSIQVIIPYTQVAPAWATRYKFVIKPDKAGYETIYSDIYFQDLATNFVYLLLEGENARKVEVGDRYIVKADATGPKDTCSYATVLEKEAKEADFLNFIAPAGVYMKMNANDFSVSNDANSKILPGYKDADSIFLSPFQGNIYLPAQVKYPMNITGTDPLNPTWTYVDYTVPEGTLIKIYLKAERPGANCSCEGRRWEFSQEFTSPANYDNMYDWFIGENIFQIIASQASKSATCGADAPVITYSTNIVSAPYPTPSVLDDLENYLFFTRNSTTNQLTLVVNGGRTCRGIGGGRTANMAVNIKVYRSTSTLIFETLPIDALPDVFYENELSLPIGPNPDFPSLQPGAHGGNIQDQDFTGSGTPAIVDTGFFNCYTFGNGAESYKIRDSIIGRTLEFGNRVTSVAAQDYQEVDRFADITYSGIYNNESNVNKLNEFNLGLINFKHCETSFGPIYILDGRQTDVLTLQEDKISYVLAGKNLLSDSAAGGAVTSVPEVLGTQMARSEKYGISFNPESYVQWGYDRYFTDAKRGAVIQMKGDSYSNDQLKVVSEMGMRSWFRDLFKNSFQTQKLGAFDPYMNEYVLSSNNIEIPQPIDCLDCGILRTFSFAEPETIDFCVDLGLPVGDVNIVYTVQGVALETFKIDALYNGGSYTTGFTTSSGTLTILKDVNNVRTVSLSVIANGPLVLDIVVDCVRTKELTIIEVVVTNDYESGKTLHTQYRYNYGTYNSPLQSAFVTFGTQLSNFVISRYNTNVGVVGTGAFPQENSTMRLISNQFASDTFVFKPTMNSFKYLMSTDFYANNTVDITTLLSLASTATPSTTSPNYNDATFTVPPILDYLYLIWDLRDSVESTLCFGTSGLDVCCNCDSCNNPCNSYTITNAESRFGAEVEYYECGETTPTTITVLSNRTVTICNNRDYIPTIISGYADITLNNECGC
tara:strand:- start:1989 stop:6656 length:4668 start_codon:yes stop_codon:yes gene_type:complete